MLVHIDDSQSHFEGYKSLLSEFGDTSKYSFMEHKLHVNKALASDKHTYLFMKDDKVVGTVTVIFDWKIFHTAFCVHIEDVVVAKSSRGKGFGKGMIQELIQRLRDLGTVYKIILNCNKSNSFFYSALGFSENEFEMRLDLDCESRLVM